MPDAVQMATVFSIPLALVLTAWLAWKAGQATADPDPILLPADTDDQQDEHYVWLVEVQFDASGNYDQYAVIDRSDDGLSKNDLRTYVQDAIPGAIVQRMEQHRLYVPGPVANQADD